MDRGYQSHKEFDLLQEESKQFVCHIKARTTRKIVTEQFNEKISLICYGLKKR